MFEDFKEKKHMKNQDADWFEIWFFQVIEGPGKVT